MSPRDKRTGRTYVRPSSAVSPDRSGRMVPANRSRQHMDPVFPPQGQLDGSSMNRAASFYLCSNKPHVATTVSRTQNEPRPWPPLTSAYLRRELLGTAPCITITVLYKGGGAHAVGARYPVLSPSGAAVSNIFCTATRCLRPGKASSSLHETGLMARSL